MYSVMVPKRSYTPKYSVIETQREIKFIKDHFQQNLATQLNLERISAPLFVFASSGLNDNLSGVERPVCFDCRELQEREVQVVQSLAKWKRDALHRYGFLPGQGIYTDMNAIRRDDTVDNIHSIYVDQWDWELVIEKGQRTVEMLRDVVNRIYRAVLDTHYAVCEAYPLHEPFLSPEIHFLTTQELEDLYPDKTPKERENAICRELGAVFLMQIGGTLRSGIRHDTRSPDYDDWSLNGDILVWNELLGIAFELSSMGVRVDEDALLAQCKLADTEDRLGLPYHQALLNRELPYTIGGGIGQSRLCMLYMEKGHIGEVHASVWPDEMVARCKQHGMFLL